MMRTGVLIKASGALAFCLCTNPAFATVRVAIDLTHQRMHVDSSEGAFDWAISSARSGFYTPGGSFAPTHLELMHYSHKYHMSPMPHAIFFRGGYAIHGTYSTASLGHPASHGCVRLAPGNATSLYNMVKMEGAQISISGTPPASRGFARHDTEQVSYRGRRGLSNANRNGSVGYGEAQPANGYGFGSGLEGLFGGPSLFGQ